MKRIILTLAILPLIFLSACYYSQYDRVSDSRDTEIIIINYPPPPPDYHNPNPANGKNPQVTQQTPKQAENSGNTDGYRESQRDVNNTQVIVNRDRNNSNGNTSAPNNDTKTQNPNRPSNNSNSGRRNSTSGERNR